jgi:hypothetical protein
MRFSSTQYPVTWFRDRYVDGTLSLKPPYQRRPVWAKKQKCYLIESILLGFPIPELYVQHATTTEGRSSFAIVDGQQRIRAVLQFIGVDSDPNEQDFNGFVLDQLDEASEFKNLSFRNLPDAAKLRIFEYHLAVRSLTETSESELREMFTRLNKYLTAAKPQELRNARYSGPLLRMVETLAEYEYWVENKIVSPAVIRRMGDYEFISELVIGVLHGPQGGGSADIDEYYRNYEDYEYEFPEQRRARRFFDKTLELIEGIFPNIREVPRWGNKTDFYTLFVGIATLLRTHDLQKKEFKKVAATLVRFGEQVSLRLADEDYSASDNVVSYVRAVEKGANDKARRAVRHDTLLRVISRYFVEKKTVPKLRLVSKAAVAKKVPSR